MTGTNTTDVVDPQQGDQHELKRVMGPKLLLSTSSRS